MTIWSFAGRKVFSGKLWIEEDFRINEAHIQAWETWNFFPTAPREPELNANNPEETRSAKKLDLNHLELVKKKAVGSLGGLALSYRS